MSGTKSPSLFGRVAAAASFVLTGRAPATWFGPSQPIAPQAPASVAGRAFDYAPAINLNTQPRIDEEISAADLRALADNCDVLRLVIETRKDQLAPIEWQFQLRDKAARKTDDPRIKLLTDFWQRPDREHSWDEWLRPLLDDKMVIDAATLYPRRTLGGDIWGFELIDGSTIKRIIDDHGRTPLPPDPAYQQILHGMPAVNYTNEELLYFPSNLRTYKLYGLSPVQQVAMTVNVALRRQMGQLEFYTAGTVPDALAGVPDGWTPEQLGDFQRYWDELLTDQTDVRRRLRFVPGAIAKGFVQTKEAALKDEFDEWLARVVCYAFSVSPQWAIKQLNRSTGETAQEMANAEGLAPLRRWVKKMVERCIQVGWDWTDIEFAWREEEATAPEVQMAVATGYLKAGVLTVNQVLANLGLDPIEGGDVNRVYTASGVVPLVAPVTPPSPGTGHNGGPPLDETDAEAALAKAADPETRLAGMWTHFLTHAAPAVAAKVAAAVPTPLTKAAGDDPANPPPPGNRLTHPDALAAEEEAARLAAASTEPAIGAAIEDAVAAMPWEAVQASTQDALAALAQAGVREGADLVQSAAAAIAEAETPAPAEPGGVRAVVSVKDATRLANPRAIAWAEAHAAELVQGMSQTTKDALNRLVQQAVSEGWSTKQLVDRIVADHAFSEERAMVIARTEAKRANSAGRIESWRASSRVDGVQRRKRVILGMNENHCAVCRSAVLEGAIDIDDTWAAGFMPPFHPSCYCNIVPVSSHLVQKAHGLTCDHVAEGS